MFGIRSLCGVDRSIGTNGTITKTFAFFPRFMLEKDQFGEAGFHCAGISVTRWIERFVVFVRIVQ